MEANPDVTQAGSPGWYYRKGTSFQEMIEADWRHEDRVAENPSSYAAATKRQVQLARKVLLDLRAGRPGTFLDSEAAELERLAANLQSSQPSLADARGRYLELRRLKRQIALANPLLRFDKLLFCKKVPTSCSHLRREPTASILYIWSDLLHTALA
jgi:hypothetical protein